MPACVLKKRGEGIVVLSRNLTVWSEGIFGLSIDSGLRWGVAQNLYTISGSEGHQFSTPNVDRN